MDLQRHVEGVREQLALAAEAGGDDARALARRLTAPLDSAVRLMLLDALSEAAAEITLEVAPASVDVRLRGGEPEFVVTGVPADSDEAPGAAGPPADAGEGNLARVNLRLPDSLKVRVEQAAGRQGLSVNAWMVRVAAAAVERGAATPRGRDRTTARGGERYTGWGR
jgi:hypothetical protein